MGTFNLLEVFREYTNKSQLDCKFLHVSTDEVYGTVRNNHKFDENTKYDPANPYSASKAAVIILSGHGETPMAYQL